MPKGKYKRSEEQIKRLGEMARMPRKLRGGGYYAVHKWLNRNYGKADRCENPNCQANKKYKSYQYALLKGKKYEHKRENFIMFCPKCHFAYDDTKERREKQSETLKGRKLTKKHKIAISKGMKSKNIGNKNACKK